MTTLGGRYEVVERIGAGGMAVVFLAEDTVLGRKVAVKRLHATAPEDNFERFKREARLGAYLNHPNLVTVFDTLSGEDGILIVMEYVPGPALADLLDEGRLDPEPTVEILRGVAAALDHAHSHGVVHRDVKPANVLLGEDGAVKLADLGVATAAHVSQITTTNDVVGTLAYIAPERLEGAERGGPPCDVYSLAAVVYEALSGRLAQRGTTPAEVLSATTNPPPDLRDVWEAAPASAAAVLRRGLDPDPRARPTSASALVDELESAFAPPRRRAVPAPAADRPTARFERAPGAPRVPHWALAAAAAGVAALVALVVVLNLPSDDPGSASSPDPASRAESGGAGAGAGSESGDGGAADTPDDSAATDPAAGAALNDEGFALIQQGRPDEAVPILRRAIDSFPEGTSDLNYAYALYNLGNALRLSGKPEEAIPILEQRLEIPNQIPTVRAELAAAREAAVE
jgi:eukaryotic-like serine/threonine-protein kinase